MRISSASPWASIVTFSAMGVVACALADMTHEVLGHLTAAWLYNVRVISLSTVAIQTAYASRPVAAAGTTANLIVGALALVLFSRSRARTNWSDFLWLYAAFNLLNSGYLVASALFQNGDWAVVISGLHPGWAWRGFLGICGLMLYVGSVRWLAGSMARRVERDNEVLMDLRRLVIAAYLAGGAILTLASIFNPISPNLILISGLGASFGLSAGLLLVPEVVKSHSVTASGTPPASRTLSAAWVGVAIIVGVIFVAVFGPGVHFRT